MIKKQLSIFILLVICTSCNNDRTNGKREIEALKSSLKIILGENERLINLLQLKENGTAYCKTYRELGFRLNHLMLSAIDTTFEAAKTDTNLLKTKFRSLKELYAQIIDSTVKSYPHSVFFKEDRDILDSMKFNFSKISNDPDINYFLNIQQFLYQHSTALNIMGNSCGVSCIWFFQIENSGYAVNTMQSESETKIKLYYRYPKRYGNFELVELDNIKDAQGKSIALKSKPVRSGDTLEIVMPALSKSNYSVNVKYVVLRATGDKREEIIAFPFKVW